MILEVVFHNVLLAVMLIIIREDVFRNVQFFQDRHLLIILPIDVYLLVQLNLIILHRIRLINVCCNVLQIQRCMQIIQQELVLKTVQEATLTLMHMNHQDFVLKHVLEALIWKIRPVHVNQSVKQDLQILKLNFVLRFVLNIPMDMWHQEGSRLVKLNAQHRVLRYMHKMLIIYV